MQIVATGRLFRLGVLVKSGDALERLSEVSAVLFDKTGTLTLGRLRIANLHAVSDEELHEAAQLARASRHPLSRAIVAAAGPISNLVLAIAAALPLRFILSSPSLMDQIPTIVLQVLFFFILINLVLMVFNLFPIPPLDGSKVLFAFLPPQVAWRWRPILEQYGFILLLLVFFVPPGDSIGGKILVPIIDALLDFLVGR